MSKSLLSAAGALALVLCAQPAAAATVPLLSGKYNALYTEYCQPKFNVVVTATASGSVITGVNPTTSGSYTASVVTANFDPGTMTVTIKGVGANSSTLMVSNNLGVTNGADPSPETVNISSPYSNTTNTVTLAGATYNAVFGPLKNSITQSGMLEAIVGPCIHTLTFTK